MHGGAAIRLFIVAFAGGGVTRDPDIPLENHQNYVMPVHQAGRDAETSRSSRTGTGAGNDAQLNSRKRSAPKWQE
ncbi:hypothetical protein ABT124_36315 [Streptomyces sp. NPDC001982]|uniref:hypothetical protein n=1 Tax=Streptomyces sp. NPDC001982 TaxID=3154405 RepID=UPI003323BC1B